MMRRYTQFLLVGIVFLLVLAAALAPGRQAHAARAAITLSSFIAVSLDDDPTVFVVWETATEIDTSGFYVQRSETNAGDSSYIRVSPFEPAVGSGIDGGQYDFTDDTTEMNKLYYYRLEEIPSDQAEPSIFHPPVVVVAGMANTPTSTPTPSRTPTVTPTRTPTLTPTATALTGSGQRPVANTPTSVVPARVNATSTLIAGETITPRPTNHPSEGSVPTAVVPTQAAVFQSNTGLPSSTPGVTPLAIAQAPANQSPLAQPAPGSALSSPATSQPAAQLPAAPNAAGPTAIVVEPVVIPTDVVPAATTAGSSSSSTSFLLLIAAAILLLAGGIAIIACHTGK